MMGHSELDLESVQAHAHPQLFTFNLAGERYGMDLLCIEQIQVWTHATRVPNAPDFVRGVTNLRGKIVPIIDGRCRFGLPQAAVGPRSTVVFARTGPPERRRIVGLLVDEVADVRTIEEPLQSHGHPGVDACIKGIANCEALMILVIDVDALLKPARRHPQLAVA